MNLQDQTSFSKGNSPLYQKIYSQLQDMSSWYPFAVSSMQYSEISFKKNSFERQGFIIDVFVELIVD